MFHADPHAGNLLYDRKRGELSILDWALTERVSREERRHLAIFFLFTALRDPQGIFNQIQALSRGGMRRKRLQVKIVRDCIDRFIERLPVTKIPGTKDALDLLESIAFKGVRLPAPLIMLRKVLLTLDGVLYDMGDPDVSMMTVIARRATVQWLTSWKSIGSPLSVRDWLAVQFSGLFYGSRVFWQGTHGLLDRSLSALSA
jgi:predicted unusual protein kinase regulating ubiquinone biosynthesis (AarF/ABC1/UbiB family)